MAFPKVTHCLICDTVRFEERNKLSLLGFLGISPKVSIGVSDFAAPLPIAFVLYGEPTTEGQYRVGFEIIDERNNVVTGSKQSGSVELTGLDPQLAMIVQMPKTKFPGPGPYRFQLSVDGHPHFHALFNLYLAVTRAG